jgi:hypothetical protein
MKPTLSLLTISCLSIFLTGATSAHADSFTFDWEATGSFTIGSGDLTAVTDTNIPNALNVTGISGTLTGSPIIDLLPCAAYDPSKPCASSGNSFLYDNLLYPGGTPPPGILVLDFRGIGLDLGNDVEGDFYASSTHQTSFVTSNPHDNGHLAGFSITLISEPGSFILFGTGILLLGMAGAVRRRIGSQRGSAEPPTTPTTILDHPAGFP